MSLTKLTTDLNIIATLADLPNATSGLTAAQLKAKFDEGTNDIKTFVNNTLTVEVDAALASGGGDLAAHKISGDHDARYYTQTLLDAGQLDTRYYTETEADAKYETITDLTTVRKLSATGDFTGTLNGYAIVAADPGLSSTVAALSADVVQRGYNIESAPYNAVSGTDSTTAIQAAIDAAYADGGGTVIIPAHGTFLFTTLLIKTNVTLKSYGGILKLKDNYCVNAGTSYYLINNLGAYDNVTLDGLIIDGNSANNSLFLVADAVTIGNENCIIRNCHIYNAPDSGIMFSGAKNGQCINNRIDGTTSTTSDVGIYVNDGDGTHLYECIISGNRITGFRNGGIAIKRISQRIIVSDNTVYSCGNGITLEQASTTTDYSKNLTIIGNRIRNVTSVGIDARSAPYCNVIGNRVENFGTAGIIVQGDTHHASVTGNVITSDGSVAASGVNKAGIFMTSRQGLFPSYNSIVGNTIEITNLTADAILGLYMLTLETNLGGGNYNIISNNIFKSTAAYGGRITISYSKNTISNNVFSGSTNDFYNNASIQNSIMDNSFVNSTPLNLDVSTETYLYKVGTQKVTRSTASPTVGTWLVGDHSINSTPAVGSPKGWLCTVLGTMGTLSGVTGSITISTAILTVNTVTGLVVGDYITIVGVTGVKKILSIVGTTVTIDSNASATVASAAVAYSNGTWVSEGNL